LGETSERLALQPPGLAAIMKHKKKVNVPAKTALNAGADATYALDVLCELVGVSPKTFLHYQEHGLIVPAGRTGPEAKRFNDETLRALRRIEHLRAHYEMNLRSLKLTLTLLHELERLRDELRSRR
jgi:MerR HTH family regulatory protein